MSDPNADLPRPVVAYLELAARICNFVENVRRPNPDRKEHVRERSEIQRQLNEQLRPVTEAAVSLVPFGSPAFEPWEIRINALRTACADLLGVFNPFGHIGDKEKYGAVTQAMSALRMAA